MNNNPLSMFLHTSPKMETISVVHLKQLRRGYQYVCGGGGLVERKLPTPAPEPSWLCCWLCVSHGLPSSCGLSARRLRELTARHRVQGSLGTSMPSQPCCLGAGSLAFCVQSG